MTISTIRTLAFFAGPIDGLRASLPMDEASDVIVLDGYDGHYEHTQDLSPTHHRFEWRTRRDEIVPPPPIVPNPLP